MKKTTGISVLYDIKACAIINDGDGTVETWTRNSSDIEAMNKIIEFLEGKSIMNHDGEREEFSEILNDIIGSSGSATVNVQESGPIEQPCPLDYYWDGHIELSDNNYATANVQEIRNEQACPIAYWVV
ncbi:hypothetical protein RND71_000982 [Anisodus tanguticus]|uniref:Uncharacterized protein n=1 Tax=Anisodus tanguticus TaxID=243964 RepID=A0AAE1VY70_9SOLA|nr:hypothetical protein RND71_000982 [Anisodus tanguticus]